ncbi:precorrin-6A synthase (deacetylating) [Pelagibacterium xiamenense]|uniref:precorrin-6A synthase (deacetylating) n=1 Tax=Pelagibacterium xiamenense TaxID=2901140 RepID=UPI001E48320D|nr:precorrin-6A synthase (deacetylating) [Pelagibacterium xiamenense]MCD7059641.1 precorrin-6A synthase (deacetylating) [Pelagibacterium xiamenense]
MRQILVIGIGTGNPAHMTVEAIDALNAADTVFIPTKGDEKAALAALRRAIVARYVTAAHSNVEFALPVRDAAHPDYQRGVAEWHEAIADRYETLIADMDARETGALLVWGDPGLYDSTLRILERVRSRGSLEFTVRVIPGLTSIQVLTAAFAIPLNTIGNPVTITTGRKLREGWPEGADSVVVMLDGEKSYEQIDPEGLHIYWGAYVGMDEEILIEGPLSEVAADISMTRDAARKQHGWIMDVYLLRKA